MMRATHSPPSSDAAKPISARARVFRLSQNAHRHFGDDAEQALRAGNDAEQIVARRNRDGCRRAAHLAGYQHQFAAEHVVGGDAVFEAMHAAGIFRDVAADGAGDLRRRIRRVIEARVLTAWRDREIGDAGLDHGDAIVEIDGADAIEFGHAEQDAVAERQRAARQRGSRPARHHLDAFAVAIAQHRGDLLGRFRQHHHHRKLAIGSEPVALVGPHGVLGRDDALARHDALQRRDDLGAASQHVVIGLRHCNGHPSLSGVCAITLSRQYSRKRQLAVRRPRARPIAHNLVLPKSTRFPEIDQQWNWSWHRGICSVLIVAPTVA